MKEDLSLEEIIKLGGDESDLKLVTSKSKQFGKGKVFKKDDLEQFYKSLGISNQVPAQFTKPIKQSKKEKPVVNKKSQQEVSGSKKKVEVTETKTNIDEKPKSKKNKKKEISTKSGMEIKLESLIQQKAPKRKIHSVESSKKDFVKESELDALFEIADNLPTRCLIKAKQSAWYNHPFGMGVENTNKKLSDGAIKRLKICANKLLENEIENFKNPANTNNNQNSEWIKTVVTAGTISDKMAAYTLLLDSSCLHNISSLNSILSLVKKKGTRNAILGMEKLKDLMIANVLPENRRLKYFQQQPLSNLVELSKNTKRVEVHALLILYAFEDQVKNIFSQYLSCLSEMLQDNNDTLKIKAMKVVYDLISSRPEQEDTLLKMLVNKFGDPKLKIGSKSLHTLHSLVNAHPAMQGIIAKEVRDLLLRPNVQERCQYYCICFLSSLILSHDQAKIADFLIEIYLAFYKAFAKSKNQNDKILSALLTGVNRAYPYATTSNDMIAKEMDNLYKTLHLSSVSTSIQSLMLLFQLLSSKNLLNDRYYNALYGSLMHPKLPIAGARHAMFLNLVFRSLKADDIDVRSCSFVKRLLQSCALHAVPYTSACLVLVAEIFSLKKELLFLVKGKINDNDLDDASDGEELDDKNTGNRKTPASWSHRDQLQIKSVGGAYDPYHRVPLYSNAHKSALWEIHTMRRHFHPTVAVFTENVVNSGTEAFKKTESDPLQDFTLLKFLDKFVFRNPKSQPKSEESVSKNTFSQKRNCKFIKKDVAANSTEFLKKKSFRPEEIFLQRYFSGKQSADKPKQIKDEDISDVESVSDEEFERYLNTKEGQMNLMEGVKNAPALIDEDKIESDDDDAMSDLDDEEIGFDLSGEEDIFEEDNRPKKKQKESDTSAMDEFGSMLEDAGNSKIDMSGSRAVSGSDKMSAKQAKWERKCEEKEIIAKKVAFKRKNQKQGGRKKFKRNKRF